MEVSKGDVEMILSILEEYIFIYDDPDIYNRRDYPDLYKRLIQARNLIILLKKGG